MLLIFVVGPGGSHPLEGGWQAWLRTLRPSGAVLFSRSLQPALGPGTQGHMDVDDRVGTEERKSPCAQRTCLVPRDGFLPQQAGTCRRERCMRFAGQGGIGWASWKGVRPRRQEEACRAALTAAPLVVPGGEGRPALPSGPAWLVMPRRRPSLASALLPLQHLPELLQEATQGLPSQGKPLHCEDWTCLLPSLPSPP